MNKCMFMGFISSDIKGEDMNLKDGSTMKKARFSIACPRKSKEKSADFVQITALGKNAENIIRYFTKGKGIFAECHVNTGKYTNKEGKTVYTSDLILDSFEFLPIRKDEESAPVEASNEPQEQTQNDTHTQDDSFMDIPESDDILNDLPFK